MSGKVITGLALTLSVFTMGYGQYKVSGKFVDTKNTPVDYLEVIISVKDSVMKAYVTNMEGQFTFRLAKGNYKLMANYFGENVFQKELDVSGSLDLGVLQVDLSTKLKGVTVEGSKKLIERKVDRLVFNVENSVAASGGDAVDALKITPGIRVQNDKISMIGKGRIAVMIDDRKIQLSGEDLVNYLRSVSADDIKSIEVITTPPAKYEAEGNSGLINIVFKKGSSNAWSNTVRTSYIQTTYPAISGGNTFNYNKNKLSVVTSLDGKKGNKESTLDYEIFFPNARNVSKMNSKDGKDYYSGRLGIDYNVSDKSLIGGIFQINESFPHSEDSSYINIFDDDNIQYSQILTGGNSTETNKNTSYNLHYIQKIDILDRKFSLDIDHFNFKENKDRVFHSTQTTNSITNLIANNKGNQDINNYSVKIDFEHPTKWINLTYGGKISFSKTDSDVAYYDITDETPTLDPSQTDDFEYKENIQALYFDIAKNFGGKWQVKLGLRYEHTNTESFSKVYNNKNASNYGTLFPTAFLQYRIGEDNFLSLNYSRRIKRPDFWELNPFKWFLNANSYAEGNPFLQPSFTHNIELTHNFKQRLFSQLILQINENGFGQLPNVNATNNQQIYTRKNFYNMNAFGLAEVYDLNPFSWWESSNQFYIFYSDTKVKNEFKNVLQVQNGLYTSFSTKNTIMFNSKKRLMGEINFKYFFPSSLYIYQSSKSYSLDFALKCVLLDSKLIATLSINDVLKTSNPDYTTNLYGQCKASIPQL